MIRPGVGIDPFELGLGRDALWARTDSNVLAYLGHSAPGERSDAFQALDVHAHYWDGRCRQLVVFSRMANQGVQPLILDDEDIAGFTRGDVAAFLELRDWPREDHLEHIRVPHLGLTFWFREDVDEPPRLEFVRVEAPVGSGR